MDYDMNRFELHEAKTVRLIQEIRKRPSTRARRAKIRQLKRRLLAYRLAIRVVVAGRKKAWDYRNRRWRYHALLAVYKGDPLPEAEDMGRDVGLKALAAAHRMVGKREVGNNDAPWLRQMENDLPHDRLDWMIPGQPYCGFGCIWAYWIGARMLLPDGTVYTPNICGWAGKVIKTAPDDRGVRFVRVPPENAKPGALVVMNFGSGGAKHVALARGPMRNGSMPTREYNTSPTNAGSQSNGGGCYDRVRPRGFILCVLNVEEA